MKAIQIFEQTSKPGEGLKYVDVAKPKIKPQHVLVKPHAIGLNPADYMAPTMPLPPGMGYPMIPGWDISGTVEESGSDLFKPGDEVFGMVNFPAPAGAYAEYVLASDSEIALKPKALDHVHAAAMTLSALTAYQALELAQVSEGQRVLIHAGAGGVGHIAVQLAKLRGAYVMTTASERHQDFLSDLGVDQIIDYRVVEFETVADRVDMVLLTVRTKGTGQKSIRTMNDGGMIVSIVGTDDIKTERNIEVRPILVQGSRENLERLAQWAASGDLKVHVQETFTFEEMAKAHREVEKGRTRGKIVVETNWR